MSGVKTATAPVVQRLLDAGRPLRRQDHHGRARLLAERQERPFRHAGERRRARPHPGRLVLGLGRGRVERAVRLRPRHRYGRLRARARRAIAACSASARPMAASASRAATTSRRPSTRAASSPATARPSRASPTVLLGRRSGALPGQVRACCSRADAFAPPGRSRCARASRRLLHRVEAHLGPAETAGGRDRRVSSPSTGRSAPSRAARPGASMAR